MLYRNMINHIAGGVGWHLGCLGGLRLGAVVKFRAGREIMCNMYVYIYI